MAKTRVEELLFEEPLSDSTPLFESPTALFKTIVNIPGHKYSVQQPTEGSPGKALADTEKEQVNRLWQRWNYLLSRGRVTTDHQFERVLRLAVNKVMVDRHFSGSMITDTLDEIIGQLREVAYKNPSPEPASPKSSNQIAQQSKGDITNLIQNVTVAKRIYIICEEIFSSRLFEREELKELRNLLFHSLILKRNPQIRFFVPGDPLTDMEKEEEKEKKFGKKPGTGHKIWEHLHKGLAQYLIDFVFPPANVKNTQDDVSEFYANRHFRDFIGKAKNGGDTEVRDLAYKTARDIILEGNVNNDKDKSLPPAIARVREVRVQKGYSTPYLLTLEDKEMTSGYYFMKRGLHVIEWDEECISLWNNIDRHQFRALWNADELTWHAEKDEKSYTLVKIIHEVMAEVIDPLGGAYEFGTHTDSQKY